MYRQIKQSLTGKAITSQIGDSNHTKSKPISPYFCRCYSFQYLGSSIQRKSFFVHFVHLSISQLDSFERFQLNQTKLNVGKYYPFIIIIIIMYICGRVCGEDYLLPDNQSERAMNKAGS